MNLLSFMETRDMPLRQGLFVELDAFKKTTAISSAFLLAEGAKRGGTTGRQSSSGSSSQPKHSDEK